MGYKSFSAVLVLGLISALPLACGSDDDSTPASTAGKGGGGGSSGGAGKGGTGGSAGKAGAGTAGKAGAGTAGTTPGTAGEGGSGPIDNVGGEAGATPIGAGGEGGAESGGAGGEAGASDAAGERMVKCETVCHFQVQSLGPETGSDPASCKGNPDDCAMDFCVNQIQHTQACFAALNTYLDCALTLVGDQDLYCSEGTDADPLLGTVRTDFAGPNKCPDAFNAYLACLPSQ